MISVREISSTEAARNFSGILDAVEHDSEEFVIVRRGKPIARLSHAAEANGAAVLALLAECPLDVDWIDDIRSVIDGLDSRVHEWPD